MKYALIGCGRIATNHVKAALNNDLEIVGLCDVIPEKIEEIMEKHDFQNNEKIRKYTDYKEMLDQVKPELVSIATESGNHAEIALYCIDKGIHLIIEKPMAMSIEDANKIIDKSKEKGVKVSSCHQNRFNVAIQEMRKAVEGEDSEGFPTVRFTLDGTGERDIMTRLPGEELGLRTVER